MATARRLRPLILLLFAPVFACGGDSTPPIGPPASLERLVADTLEGTVGGPTSVPLRVRVTDADGQAVPGVAVDFRTTSGGGTVAVTTATGTVEAGAVVDSTDLNGEASVTWTLGTRTGLQDAAARVVTVGEVTFTALATADVPADLAQLDAAAFIGVAGAPADGPLVVRVVDQFNNVVPNASVGWSAITAGAAVASPTTSTDEDGVARVSVTLAPAPVLNLFAASLGSLAPDTFGVLGVVGTTDPRGDAFGTGDPAFVSHDVVFFGGTVVDSILVLYFRFVGPVAGTSTSGSQPANGLIGNLDLDLDRDSTTGLAALRQCIGGDSLGFGTDAFVELDQRSGFLSNFPDPPAGAVVVARVDSLSGADPCTAGFFGALLATVPEYRDSTVSLAVPLGFLQDDGEFDLTTFFGSAGTSTVTDVVPDSLAYTFTIPAPVAPAVAAGAPDRDVWRWLRGRLVPWTQVDAVNVRFARPERWK